MSMQIYDLNAILKYFFIYKSTHNKSSKKFSIEFPKMHNIIHKNKVLQTDIRIKF